jgi:hypothetical protein
MSPQRPRPLHEVYAEAQAKIGPDWCPIEAGLIGKLADCECPHGSLPTDRHIACACWGRP